MSRRYPEPVGPRTESELLAWLFGMLGGAYSRLAQHEAAEEERDREQRGQQIRRAFGPRDAEASETPPAGPLA